MTQYITEFLHFSERNELGKSENQKATRYINCLKRSLQENINLQTVWTMTEASSLQLKA